MGSYSRYTCADCGVVRSQNLMKSETREVLRGRSGGSVSGNPFAKNTLKSIRVHTGRKYYSIKTVQICKDKKACGDPDYYERIEREEKRKLDNARKAAESKVRKRKELEKRQKLERARDKEVSKIRKEIAANHQDVWDLVDHLHKECLNTPILDLTPESKSLLDRSKTIFRQSVSNLVNETESLSANQKVNRLRELNNLLETLSFQQVFANWMSDDYSYISNPMLTGIPKEKSVFGFLKSKYMNPPKNFDESVKIESIKLHENLKKVLSLTYEEVLRKKFASQESYKKARSIFFHETSFNELTIEQESDVLDDETSNVVLPDLKIAVRQIDNSEDCIAIITRILAPYVASSDGFVSIDEIRWIESELDLDELNLDKISVVLNHIQSRQIGIKIFNRKYSQNPRAKELLINNLLTLAIVDGLLDEREIEAIREISKEIKMSPVKFKSLLSDSESVLSKQKRDKIIISDDIDDDPYNEFDEFLD